mmetsp:Transcript_8612/g.25796  ORF Transcript_8612/g.25796 Transcript_8612/m.25796 type:complete len:136 (+) Transcript_8612:1025-1432(+)
MTWWRNPSQESCRKLLKVSCDTTATTTTIIRTVPVFAVILTCAHYGRCLHRDATCPDDGRATPDFRFERNALDGAALNVRATRTCTAAFAIAEEIASMAAVDFGWGAERNGPRAEAPFFPTPSALAPPRPTVQLE